MLTMLPRLFTESVVWFVVEVEAIVMMVSTLDIVIWQVSVVLIDILSLFLQRHLLQMVHGELWGL